MILNHIMRIYEESTTRVENEYGRKIRNTQTATIAEIICNVQDEESNSTNQNESGIDVQDRVIVFISLDSNIATKIKNGTYVSFDTGANGRYSHNILFIAKKPLLLYSNHYEIECDRERKGINKNG